MLETNYVLVAGAAAGAYALYQLKDYCIQKGRFSATDSDKIAEKAESMLQHTDSVLEKVLFFGKRQAAKSYLEEI